MKTTRQEEDDDRRRVVDPLLPPLEVCQQYIFRFLSPETFWYVLPKTCSYWRSMVMESIGQQTEIDLFGLDHHANNQTTVCALALIRHSMIMYPSDQLQRLILKGDCFSNPGALTALSALNHVRYLGVMY